MMQLDEETFDMFVRKVTEQLLDAEAQKKMGSKMALRDIFRKWYHDQDEKYTQSRMAEAFGSPYRAYNAWETIRKLTLQIFNVRQVKDLRNIPEAQRVADKLCQTVYDILMERRKNGRGKEAAPKMDAL